MLTKQRKHFGKRPNKSEDPWGPFLSSVQTIQWMYEEEKSTGKSCQPARNEETRSAYWPEVGIRYFSHNPLPLVRYIEIVLPLCAGPQLSNVWYSASPGPLFRYHHFFRSGPPLACNSSIPLQLFSLQSTATSPQFRYSATAIFTVVHCTLQFAIPRFPVPQYQFQPPII
jgi:hypothetical protein